MAAHSPARVTRPRRAELLRGIYAILNDAEDMLALAEAVLDGGVRILQYRAKDGIVPDRLRSLRALTRARDALLIVNDDWRAAEAFDCDGVHLGPGDQGYGCVATLRRDLRERLIGCSCATIDEVRAAAGADYIGVGSIYATLSKLDAGPPIGPARLRAVAQESVAPVAAVGGITPVTLPEIRRSGAAMAAVISAIAGAAAPRRAAAELVEIWKRGPL
ncbi:MAG: thiamine phosphate synthase [Candidatus Eremiobacteraeota bacterium]|nr:thiamine phosphate synthase [Candidatus Eremiobacteraeota bacterium]